MLWDQFQFLSKEVKQHLLAFYKQRDLNPQIRARLSPWIESRILKSNLTPGCQDHDAHIGWLHMRFLEEIDRVMEQLDDSDDFLLSLTLAEERRKISNTLPHVWYQQLKECLAEEGKFISQQIQQELEQVGLPGGTNEFNHTSIHRKIREIQSAKETLTKYVNHMLHIQANLRLANHTLTTMQAEHINGQQKDRMDAYQQQINDYTTTLLTVSNKCMEISNKIMAEVDTIVSRICEEFKRTLQWSCYPADQFPVLETIQQWYSELLECIVDMRGCIFTAGQQESIEDPSFAVPFWAQSAEHLRKLDLAYRQLLNHVLAVRDQPPEVVKTKTKLKLKPEGLTVKLLAKPTTSAKFWTADRPLKVEVTVVNEEEAKAMYETGKLTADMKLNSKKIKNSVGLSKSDGSYSFANMTINDIHRPTESLGEHGTKKAQGILTSQFCLVFYTTMKPITGDAIEVWCCSRPFVAIVGDGQLQEAYGIVLWDSMHESPRVPFALPKTAPWSRVAWALNRYVQTRTKLPKESPTDPEPPVWSLTSRNLQVLGEKLFEHGSFNDSTLVPADKFLTKDGQKGFWDWFYKAVELIEHHLKKHWNNGHIIGFINRRDAESLLQTLNNPGSFILRFSDSVHGAISICSYSPWDSGQLYCKNLGPADDKDLAKLDIAKRLAGGRYETVVHESCEPGQMVMTTRKADAFPIQIDSGTKANGYVPFVLSVLDNFDNLSMSPTSDSFLQHNMPLWSSPAYMSQFPASPTNFAYSFSPGAPDQNQVSTTTGNITTNTDVLSMALNASFSVDSMDISMK